MERSVEHSEVSSSRTDRLVVVGNGMVGQRFVDEVLSADVGRRWSITVLGDEPRPAYDRVALSSYFDGATDDDLRLADPASYDPARVTYRLGTRVDEIDRERRFVTLDDERIVTYDHLVLATGSTPFVPPMPGHDAPGCFVYRTIDDLIAIRDWASQPGCERGVVIGGGLLGLEAANALRNLGLKTHVVELGPQLMPQQLDPAGGRMLARWIDDLGVHVHCGVRTERVLTGTDGSVHGLRFENDDDVAADIVLFSAGIRPADALGRSIGLEIGERGGIVVDDHLRTSDHAISAIGEVACHRGRVHGLVAPGYDMARCLASTLTAGSATTPGFAPEEPSAKLKLLGVEVASFGRGNAPCDERLDEIVYSDAREKVHRRLVVDVADGAVVGGTMVGDVSGYDMLKAIAAGQVDTPADVAARVLPADLALPTDGALPDAALVCSCNAVSAGRLRDAVGAGCHTVAALKSETTAGTGCAGCVPAMTALLDAELAAAGIATDTRLCEHFAHSRQELYDLIRFHRHTTWAGVLADLGSGRGCEVCRPTVASILASLDTGYILDGDQAALQDTNDHVLANMQRDGTYSVVPRLPGGEVTPEQLIALGEIARDFRLYTKITGGQRVDLFGARIDQLPEIWRRVIDAGMESGHAYGKALRTVKSCVGSVWCRYGVQDSVAMAVRIERRYRGLRAPHKIKSAVSGCTRECAEAQSKDVGVIATENGWNLYLAGNGGRAPRHADLFATDLDDETLIRYIDRFLMFYIRTADRLERTSVWFEGLEGGLDYLRSVIVDDVLGICDELEADMARHVEQYECEWTATLADEERLAHFVEFVNAPAVGA